MENYSTIKIKLTFLDSEQDNRSFDDLPFEDELLKLFTTEIEDSIIELFIVPQVGMYINIIHFLDNISFSLKTIPVSDYLKNEYCFGFYDLEIINIIIQKNCLELDVLTEPKRFN